MAVAYTKPFSIPCSQADIKAAGDELYNKYRGRIYRYAWPELQQPGYAVGGSRSYYWCAAHVRRVYQLASGGKFDLADFIGGGWASTTYEYNALAASPSTLTVAPQSARLGDIYVVGHGNYTTHTGMVWGNGSRWAIPVQDGDTSSPNFPGSDTTGGCLERKMRDLSYYSNHTGMSSGYFIRIWRMPLTGRSSGIQPPIMPRPKTTTQSAWVAGPRIGKALQDHFHSPGIHDGHFDDQDAGNRAAFPPAHWPCIRWVPASSARGSIGVAAIQRGLHVHADGLLGPATAKALQQWAGATVDGICGDKTVAAIAHKLNIH